MGGWVVSPLVTKLSVLSVLYYVRAPCTDESRDGIVFFFYSEFRERGMLSYVTLTYLQTHSKH